MSILNRKNIKKIFPPLTKAYRWCKRRKIELPAIRRHINRRKKQKKKVNLNNRKIIVVFICQYIPAWSKNKQLYESLKADKRFKTILLCIPNRVSANHLVNPEDLSNDSFDYFVSHGYSDAVNALIGHDKWFDLEGCNPDYVIYNRYDRPMPIQYTSAMVSAYAKVCLIVYGCALLRMEERMIDASFAANTFCFFAESEGIKKEFIRNNTILTRLNLSKAICCGIPAVENAYKSMNDRNEAWSFSKNSFRIIYTPRWTLNPAWGGSSFPEYRGTFLKIADDYPNIDILIRPHPLMFDHFVSTGVLTKEEVEKYEEACLKRTNIRLDIEKEYHATFWNSSLLICDYSSMMIEYFVTMKPIIYLTYDETIEYTDQMNAMLSCCYIVKNENELVKVIDDLAKGIDPLAKKREEVCKRELLSNNNITASENMKEFLLKNYHS